MYDTADVNLTNNEKAVLNYCVERGNGLYKSSEVEKVVRVSRAYRYLRSLASNGFLKLHRHQYGLYVEVLLKAHEAFDKKPSRAKRRLNYFKRKYFERYAKEYYEPKLSQKALLGIIKKLEDRGLLEGYEEAVDIYFVRTRIGHSLKDFSKDGVLKDVLAVMSRERKATAEPEREEVDMDELMEKMENAARRKAGEII